MHNGKVIEDLWNVNGEMPELFNRGEFMIRQIEKSDIAECVKVVKESFLTVADTFGFTVDNAPRFVAFSISDEQLYSQFNDKHRFMYAFYKDNIIIGYYSLVLMENNECELNNLCVLPTYRHKGIGNALISSVFENAKKICCTKINIGIVEENKKLRCWYESLSFV